MKEMILQFGLLVISLIGACVATGNPHWKQSMVANNIISQKLFSAVVDADKRAKKVSAPTAHIHMENHQLGSTVSKQKPTDEDDERERKKPPLDLRDVWKNIFGVRDPLTWLATRREELGFEVPEGDDGTGEKMIPPLDLREVWKRIFRVRDPLTYIAAHRDELGYK